MTYAIKRNTRCQAWELGKGTEMEQSMINHGKICVHPNGMYEILSLEAHGEKGNRNTEETAACDSVIVFFDIKRDSDGKIEEINFNFVDAEYFENNYSLIKVPTCFA